MYKKKIGHINSAFTAYQTKAIGGANGGLWSTWVGGDRVIKARMVKSDGSAGAWTYDINDQSSYILPGRSNQLKGNAIRLELDKQGLLDLTSVDVSGYWKSN